MREHFVILNKKENFEFWLSGNEYYLTLHFHLPTIALGDIVYVKADLSTQLISELKDAQGNTLDLTRYIAFNGTTLFPAAQITTNHTIANHQPYELVTANPHSTELQKWFEDADTAYLKLTFGDHLLAPIGSLDHYFFEPIDVVYTLPSSTILINGKKVAGITMDNGLVDAVEIDGKLVIVPKAHNHITIKQSEVQSFVNNQITWSGVSTTPDLTISSGDYTSVVRSTPYANCIHLVDYTWPSTVETKNSVMLTFTDDIDAFYTTSDHFWISKGDTFTADAIKVMSAPWPSQSFKAGETWLFSTTGIPVKVDKTATIDTSVKLKGFAVEYSKSTGLLDGDKIVATVKYDSAIADTLNGTTTDAAFLDIKIVNPDLVLTDDEIKKAIQGAITWNGKVGQLDVSKWPYTGTTLYTSNPQVGDGVAVDFRIGAANGFTINGGATYTLNYAPIAAAANSDDWYGSVGSTIYKNAIQLYSVSSGAIKELVVGPKGDVYSISGDCVYKNNTKIFDAPYRHYTYKLCVDKDDNVYFTSNNGLFKNNTLLYPISGQTYAMSISEDGSLMINNYYSIMKDEVQIFTMNAWSMSGRGFDKDGNFFFSYGTRINDKDGQKVSNPSVNLGSHTAYITIDGDGKIYGGDRGVAIDLDYNYYAITYFDTALLKNGVVVDTKGHKFEHIAPATEYGGRTGNW